MTVDLVALKEALANASYAAGRDPAKYVRPILVLHAQQALARTEALEAQLPQSMQDCTILFKQCERGHGWLTAANWLQHPCGTCRIEALEADNARLREALQFYARENSWKSCGMYMSGRPNPSSAEIDGGNKARAALKGDE